MPLKYVPGILCAQLCAENTVVDAGDVYGNENILVRGWKNYGLPVGNGRKECNRILRRFAEDGYSPGVFKRRAWKKPKK